MSAATEPRIVRSLPGRIRIHLPSWSGVAPRAVERALSETAGVHDVTANSLTVNVLVRYDEAEVGTGELIAAAARAARAANRQSAREATRSQTGDLRAETSALRAHTISEQSGDRIRRVRIPVNGLERSGRVAARVVATLRRRAGVRRVSASPLTGRVLVEFEERHVQLADLLGDVAKVELPPLPGEDRPCHPLDRGPLLQSTARAVGAGAGLALLAARRLMGRTEPPLPDAAGAAAALGIVDGLPPLRSGLRDLLGRDRAELVFGGLSALSLTLAGSPLGLAVTGFSAWRIATEARARRAAFRAYDESLRDAVAPCPGERIKLGEGAIVPMPGRVIEGEGTVIDRDAGPTPVGPGDRLSPGGRLAGGPFLIDLEPEPTWDPHPPDRARPRDVGDPYLRLVGPISLAHAGLTLVFTRSWRRAVAALLLVNARVALIGRDAANTEASNRAIRGGGVIVASSPDFCVRRPAVLFLDGPRAVCDGLEIAEVRAVAQDVSRKRLLSLASGIAAAGGSPWGPIFPAADRVDATDGTRSCGAVEAMVGAERYRLSQIEKPAGDLRTSCDWLSLDRQGERVGLIALRPKLADGVRELVDTCRRRTVAVAIIGRHDPSSLAVAERVDLPLLAVDPRDAVRSSQAMGAIAALASDSPAAAAALYEANLGIGLTSARDGRFLAPADLLAPDLNALAGVIEAGARRDIAVTEAVLLSVASDIAGALWGIRGAPAIRRAARATYIAALAAMVEAWRQLRGGRSSSSLAQRLVDPRPERWGELTVAKALKQLDANRNGLTTKEAERRRVARPEARRANPVVVAVADQMRSPLTTILLAGAGLSFALGAMADVVMIAAVIATNAAVGAWQERQAEEASDQLERMGAASAQVLRDGDQVTVSADELVRGDVLVLSPGDRVTADARLIDADSLELDEASLTGESQPVVKDPRGPLASDRIVLEGSDVTVGSGRAVVFAVGEKTRIGATAAALEADIAAPSPLGARLSAILRQGVPIVAAGGGAVAVAGMLWGRPLVPQLAVGASIAIAAVPEGLPLLTGVAQAAVARRLAGRKALVRRLSAVEALGRVDVACADKTGTLTEGKLGVTLVAGLADDESAAGAEHPEAIPEHHRQILLAAALASPHPDSPDARSHPTDVAVLEAAVRAGLGAQIRTEREDQLPFDPGRSFHAAVVEDRLVVKGAAEVLIDRTRVSQRDDEALARLAGRAEELASRGLRLLMVAEAPAHETDLKDPRDLTALGFLGISDPLRASVPAAITRCQEAGVRVLMLTGDHPVTALAVAKEAGLARGKDEVLTGGEVAQLDDRDLDRRLERTSVVARITPLDKLRIVERLQARGHTVAMTGDGVNDAPALRLADVGVAMGGHGTEVARQTSDLVLADDDFSTLAEALVEGRAFWLNIRRALALLLGGNLGELGLMVGAGVIGQPPPMTTRQILAVNLFSDVMPAVAVAIQPPEHRELSALAREGAHGMDKQLPVDVVRRGVATAIPAFAAYVVASRSMSPVQAQTVAFASIVGTQLAQTWDIGRSEGTFSRSVLGAVLGTGAVVASVISFPPINGFLGFVPPPPLGIALIAAAGVAAIALGRMRGDQLGVRKLAALLPQTSLSEG